MKRDFISIERGEASVSFLQDDCDSEVILEAAHSLTDQAYVHVEAGADGRIYCRIKAKQSLGNVEHLAGELANRVVEFRLRAKLKAETEPVRMLLIAQAFSRVDLLNPDSDDGAD